MVMVIVVEGSELAEGGNLVAGIAEDILDTPIAGVEHIVGSMPA